MSFGCQLSLCWKTKPESFVALVKSLFCSYEFNAASPLVVADGGGNTNNCANFEARRVTENRRYSTP
jgi:hypothetical protein